MLLKILIGAVSVLALVVILLAWYVFDVARSGARVATVSTNTAVNKTLENNSGVSGIAQGDNNEVKALVDKVGKHIIFPAGSVTVATVVDPNYLRQQNSVFFQYAKEGDKLLAYPNGFILYDPAADRIIDLWRLAQKPSTP